jgi:hypothetical protein
MPLTDLETREAASRWAEKWYEDLAETAGYDLDHLKTQVTNLVTFIEGNSVAINNQFTEPFKTTASIQKKRYMLAVAAARLAGMI